MVTTVKELQKRIVKALETGEDPGPILSELAEVRTKIASEAELDALQKVAGDRQVLRDKAAALGARIEKQGKAIDDFLKLRDSVCKSLTPILVKAKSLPELQEECTAQFSRSADLVWMAKLPVGYLPEGQQIPFLTTTDGVSQIQNKAKMAVAYIGAGLGWLQSIKREYRPLPVRPPATELEAIDEIKQ